MFKSFLKKFEETTESIKGSILSSPTQSPTQQQQQQQQQQQAASGPVQQQQQQAVSQPIAVSSQQQQQQQQQATSASSPISQPISQSPLSSQQPNVLSQSPSQQQQQQSNSLSSSSSFTTTETLKYLNPSNLNYQPMVDVIKGSVVQPVAQALNNSLRLEMDTIKEIEMPQSVLQTVSSITSTVALSSMNISQSIPNVAQIKDSLKEIDLYNGTLLLRNFEVKLKQIRTNGQILGERAEEVDKKFPEVIRFCSSQYDQWKKAEIEFNKLSEINSLVESVQLNIESIISKIESLEIQLSIDIDNHVENELLKWKEKKESELIKLDNSKKLELNKLQEDLSIQYQKYEREKILKERQALLDKERERKSSNPPQPAVYQKQQQQYQQQPVLNNSNNNIIINNSNNNNIINNNIDNHDSNNNNNNQKVTIDNIVIENPYKEELESFLGTPNSEDTKSNQEKEESGEIEKKEESDSN